MRIGLHRSRKACVLGCGPAGLFAAHALDLSGWDVRIYSNKRKSEMFGAQYLHEPIPDLSNEQFEMLHYRLVGSPEGYVRKVYGVDGLRNGLLSSVETLPGLQKVWDIRTAYNIAWARYYGRISNFPNINATTLGAWAVAREMDPRSIPIGDFDLVISSLPAPDICYRPYSHVFRSQSIWASGDAPERGVFCPIKTVDDFTVICNGIPDVGWYRASQVFGYRTAEWPESRKPPYEGVAAVSKPLSTNCDCWNSKKFLKVGRFGTWTKGVLAHQAYDDVKALIS